MGRQEAIARSIVLAITGQAESTSGLLPRIFALLLSFFSLYQLPLQKIQAKVFAGLRQKNWNVNDEDYVAAFTPKPGKQVDDELKAIGDMGFSGSVWIA